MNMATDHAFEGEQHALPPQASEDLTGLLSSVISRFDEADRRNEALLREMHGQIEQLRAEARHARPGVPDVYRSGFERIEDGMTLLAARLAETCATSSVSPSGFHSIANAFAAPGPFSGSGHDGMNQAPLMSAAGPAARSRFGKSSAHGDTFDVIESPSADPSEPWNAEEVAALNEIYSSRDMLFAPAEPLHAPEPAAVVAHASAPSADRDWIDGRLSEITRLIVESRSANVPDKAITALSERFDMLENHLTDALRGIARAEDIGGFHQIEGHISDLTAKVEQLHAELARFEALENRLGVIEQRVESPAQAASHSEADLHALAIAAAEAAAGRVAEHVSRDQNRSTGPDRVSEVHDMLTSYMTERRQGDEQTAAILDTLQQAMVHLLDRVDTRAEVAGPAHAATIAHQPMAEAADAPADEFEAAPDFGHRPSARQSAPAPVAAPAPAATPVSEIADPIARQRASLQQSAQRAAQAQRDKQAAEDASKVKGAKGSDGKKASGWRRLMVRGLVLAVAVGAGAGTMAFLPSTTSVTTASLKLAASPTSTAVASNNSEAGVTGEIVQPSGQANSSVSSVITNDKPQAAPMTGILIQDQPPQAGVTAPASSAPDQATGVTKVSANGADATADADGDQSKAALGLPPLTVGPSSLRMAAGNGDPSAEFEVASRLAEGKGTDQNLALAARWYQRSASKGFVQSQYRLGTLYERGLGVTKDLNRAKVWYQRAAEQGNVKSMHNLAVLAAGRSGVAPDYATAAKWFAKAAENGLADSQFNLAVLTESGLGVAKDKIAAAEWYAIAARSGDREAIRRRDAMRGQLSKPEQARLDAFVQTWQPQVSDRIANDPTAAGQAWKQRQPGEAPASADNG